MNVSLEIRSPCYTRHTPPYPFNNDHFTFCVIKTLIGCNHAHYLLWLRIFQRRFYYNKLAIMGLAMSCSATRTPPLPPPRSAIIKIRGEVIIFSFYLAPLLLLALITTNRILHRLALKDPFCIKRNFCLFNKDTLLIVQKKRLGKDRCSTRGSGRRLKNAVISILIVKRCCN